MPVPKPKYREIIFQILFSQDIGKTSEENLIALLTKELSVTKKTIREALLKAGAVQEKIQDIDDLIRKTSLSYNFERIQSVERNVLRLGVYELLFDESIPPKVAISEAMRISKKFGTPESAAFVNALLDAIYKSLKGEEHDEEALKETAQELEALEKETEKKKKLLEESQER